ncbi:MAG TPA: type II toxin-antitoxin system RelE/ParE family toxin [Rhizomicrobium sp.]|jgi:phage-related protein
MSWSVIVDERAAAEIRLLPADMKGRFLRITQMIENNGLTALREPHVKHLDGKLWEIRLKGRDGIARSIYATASGQRVIVLRTFVKKTRKTPPQELKIALARLKEYEE